MTTERDDPVQFPEDVVAVEPQGNTTPLMIVGAFLILAGIVAMGHPLVSGVAVVWLFGWLLIVGGVLHTLGAFRLKKAGKVLLRVLVGVVYIVAGAWIIAYPFAGLLSITLLLAAVFLVEGVARVLYSLKLRPDAGWGWVAISGLASILLAFLIWGRWPLSSAYSVGLLAGVNFAVSGVSYVMLAMSKRKG
jgi:uncharacterized membrane protein HdeD (DUF308 family)